MQKLEFSSIPNSLEVSRDGTVVTVAHGNQVSFWDAATLNKIREFPIPTIINSASLHPYKSIFVAGGDDFKMYKFDYTTGSEIGKYLINLGNNFCAHKKIFIACGRGLLLVY